MTLLYDEVGHQENMKSLNMGNRSVKVFCLTATAFNIVPGSSQLSRTAINLNESLEDVYSPATKAEYKQQHFQSIGVIVVFIITLPHNATAFTFLLNCCVPHFWEMVLTHTDTQTHIISHIHMQYADISRMHLI